MRLPANPSCVLVQMQATTLVETPAYRRMSRHSLGDIAMSRIASVPQSVAALLDEVPALSPESTQLQLVHSGELILSQDGRQTRIVAGELLVYDVSRPFEFVYPESFTTTILQIPTRALGVSTGELQTLSAHPISTGSATATVLSTLLREAGANQEVIGANGRAVLARSIVDTARLIVQQRAGRLRTFTVPDTTLRRAALGYVETHLTDPALSASSAAAALHVSVRSLHGAFHGQSETLGATIRRLRADRARRLLAATSMPVGSVAESVGYLDVTGFIRMFKEATGHTPARWRRRERATGPDGTDA